MVGGNGLCSTAHGCHSLISTERETMSNFLRPRISARVRGLLVALWLRWHATCSAWGMFSACQTACSFFVFLGEHAHGLLFSICLVAAFLAQLGCNGLVIWICLDVLSERNRHYLNRWTQLLALLLLLCELGLSSWLVWAGLHHAW